jgi:hypothetical protein
VSLLWRKRLRISLAADRLVLRAGKARTSTVALQADPNSVEWRAALDALPAVLASFTSHEVSVVLADRLVRYALLPWNAAVRSEEQWMALARHRLAAVHGATAADWDVRLAETARNGPRLACAMDRALLEELAAVFVAANARLVSVQPFLVAAFNRIRDTVGGGSCWLVVEEPSRLTLAFIQRGVWLAVRSRRADAAWRANLPELIGRESAFLALSEPVTRVIVCAQGEFDPTQYEAWQASAVDYSELALAWEPS